MESKPTAGLDYEEEEVINTSTRKPKDLFDVEEDKHAEEP